MTTAIKHYSAGDALIAALSNLAPVKERQHSCILVRDFYSFESDKWTLVSPSGKAISIWAHHKDLEADKTFRDIIARYDSSAPAAPNSECCAASHWGHGRAIKCTRSEMINWKNTAQVYK